MCDGIDHCGDGSDENNHTLCANKPRICPNLFSDFKCANDKCIKRTNICNLVDDCGDRSDEHGCHQEGKCENKVDGKRGGCQHRCNNLPDDGYLCLCDRGYIVDPENPKKCKEIDECENFGNNCTHLCTNINGTYACSCRDGFTLTDRFSGVCKVKDGEVEVLFSTGSEIRGQLLGLKQEVDVVKKEARIEAVDYDPNTMMVYWADSQEKAIKRSFIPGTPNQPEAAIGHPQIIQHFESKDITPKALSYDWIAKNIYWVEIDRTGRKSRGIIMVAKEDGRYKRSIVASNLDEPTSIAVDPEHGLMYWTDAGNSPKIEVSWMDGSKRRTIVNTNINRPEAITIDFAMGHTLYWADSKLNKIESMDPDGRKRHIIVQKGGLNHPISLDIFENSMFFVTNDNGALVQMDKFGRGVPVTLAKEMSNPQSVRVLHSKRYNDSLSNPCSNRGWECSHLCLVIPGGRSRCKCPTGQRFIDKDHTICDAGNGN